MTPLFTEKGISFNGIVLWMPYANCISLLNLSNTRYSVSSRNNLVYITVVEEPSAGRPVFYAFLFNQNKRLTAVFIQTKDTEFYNYFISHLKEDKRWWKAKDNSGKDCYNWDLGTSLHTSFNEDKGNFQIYLETRILNPSRQPDDAPAPTPKTKTKIKKSIRNDVELKTAIVGSVLIIITVIILLITISIPSTSLTTDYTTPSDYENNIEVREREARIKNNIKKLYNAFVEMNYEVGTEEDFAINLTDPENRRAVYDAYCKEYEAPPFNVFESRLGYGNYSMANESTIWLYEQLTGKGYNVGKNIDEFDNLMRTNAESRQWAYDTATKLGLNVGKDIDEFSSLVGGVDASSSQTGRAPYAGPALKAKKPTASTKSSNGSYLGVSVPSSQGNTPVPTKTQKQPRPKIEKPTYVETTYHTGDSPFKNAFGNGSYDWESLSTLSIKNYSETDAVVLLVASSGKVIRNAFVKKGNTFTMEYIPAYNYIIKTMLGNSWNADKYNGPRFPRGGFMKNENFSQSRWSEPFDFRPTEDYNSGTINYPTYSVTLHKVANGNFHTDKTTKENFFSGAIKN